MQHIRTRGQPNTQISLGTRACCLPRQRRKVAQSTPGGELPMVPLQVRHAHRTQRGERAAQWPQSSRMGRGIAWEGHGLQCKDARRNQRMPL
jgi:hypothetical protein